jgi:hypothetical protein
MAVLIDAGILIEDADRADAPQRRCRTQSRRSRLDRGAMEGRATVDAAP